MLTAMKNEKASEYNDKLERYKKETDGISEKAKEFETDSHLKGKQALRFHFGEIFLEVAIVFASLAILTKRKMLWGTAIVSGALGAAIALTVFTIH